ncbi:MULTISPECIES: hypothetical protein [Halomonadaceae]|uniref:hypothetical protein n=1 Tax=Halomonadaceae TaxID=28256 RepID=UPI001749B55E
MRTLTIAALMVASMAGSSVAMAGNPADDGHAAKSQYTQHKDSVRTSAQSHKAAASGQVADKSSHVASKAHDAKSKVGNAKSKVSNARSKASDTNSRYQKKNYADVLKNERH